MEATGSELRRDWRIVAGCFLGVAGGFSSLFFYSVGLFLRPLATDFGWSRSEASLQAVAIAVANFVAVPVAGRLVDRYGALRPAFLSLLALSLGFLLLGTLTTGIVSFLLLSAIVTAASAASNPVSFNRILVARFQRSRGTALGLTLTAIGLGATLLPIVLSPIIAVSGWRTGYFALAAGVLPFTAGMLLLLRGEGWRAHVSVPSAPMADIVFTKPFLVIAALIFLIAMPELGTVVHLVAMLTDRGKSPADVGAAASVLGVAVIGGRVLTGRLLDSFDAGLVTAGVLLLSASGMLLLYSGQPVFLIAGIALAGAGLGCESDLIAFLVGRRFALNSFGAAYGCVFAAHVVGAGVGPVLAGALYDANGNYNVWLLLAAASLTSAAALAWTTQRGGPGEPVTLGGVA